MRSTRGFDLQKETRPALPLPCACRPHPMRRARLRPPRLLVSAPPRFLALPRVSALRLAFPRRGGSLARGWEKTERHAARLPPRLGSPFGSELRISEVRFSEEGAAAVCTVFVPLSTHSLRSFAHSAPASHCRRFSPSLRGGSCSTPPSTARRPGTAVQGFSPPPLKGSAGSALWCFASFDRAKKKRSPRLRTPLDFATASDSHRLREMSMDWQTGVSQGGALDMRLPALTL